MKPKPKPSALPVYDSMEQMSGALGIPKGILQSAKKAGCMFIVHGRCHLDVFISWFFAQNLSDDEKENWAMRNKKAVALLNECKLQKERDSVVDRALMTQMLNEVIGNCYAAELERYAKELPAVLKGKTETEIHAELIRQKLIARDTLFSRLDEWNAVKQKEEDASAR